MKKVLFALILAGGIFAFSSCTKTCDCSGKWDGEVVYEQVVDREDGDKCSDYNTTISAFGHSVQVKCTPNLF